MMKPLKLKFFLSLKSYQRFKSFDKVINTDINKINISDKKAFKNYLNFENQTIVGRPQKKKNLQ